MGVKHLLKAALGLGVILVLLSGCFPPLPPEAERPPDPGVVVPPEEHQGRAQEFARENYNQLLLLGRSARKRNHLLVFDRKGIRFEEQKEEIVLIIQGRYFQKFDRDKVTPQAEAQELWRAVVSPLLEEIFVKGNYMPGLGPGNSILGFDRANFKLGFDRVAVTLRYERESSSHPGFTEEAEGLFDVKAYKPEEGPKPQKVQIFLSRTLVKIGGKDLVLRE